MKEILFHRSIKEKREKIGGNFLHSFLYFRNRNFFSKHTFLYYHFLINGHLIVLSLSIICLQANEREKVPMKKEMKKKSEKEFLYRRLIASETE
jgi:hypothetical protein